MNWLTVVTSRGPVLGDYLEVRLNLDHVIYAEVVSPTDKHAKYKVELVTAVKRYYSVPEWTSHNEAQAWIDRFMPSIG